MHVVTVEMHDTPHYVGTSRPMIVTIYSYIPLIQDACKVSKLLFVTQPHAEHPVVKCSPPPLIVY